MNLNLNRNSRYEKTSEISENPPSLHHSLFNLVFAIINRNKIVRSRSALDKSKNNSLEFYKRIYSRADEEISFHSKRSSLYSARKLIDHQRQYFDNFTSPIHSLQGTLLSHFGRSKHLVHNVLT